MLRSTRPLWTSSARGLVAPRRQATQLTSLSNLRTSTATNTARSLPLSQRTSYATTPIPNKPNPEEEKKWAQEKLQPHPESVSVESSVRHFLEPDKGDSGAKPVSDGISHDLNLVKETFALSTVPKESFYLGLAGTIPYLATSFSNVYLSWALNTTWPASSNFLNSILMTPDNARYWLGVVEPLQMGYGAVIISFLGAIHWGLEYAEKKPSYPRTQLRYGLGVLASVVAWPTLFLPWQFALTGQFAAFVGLYFADSRATVRGWAPYWYGTYRFVLTAIVGAAIMISLIGRAKIGDTAPRLSGLGEKFHETHGEEAYSDKWAKKEEPAREEFKKKQAEEKKRKEEEEQKAKEEEEKKQKEEAAQKKKDEAAQKKGKGDGKSKSGDKKGDKSQEKSKDDKPKESSKDDKPEEESKDDKPKEESKDDKPKEEQPKNDGKKDQGGNDKKEGKSDKE